MGLLNEDEYKQEIKKSYHDLYVQIKDFLRLIPDVRQLRPETETFKEKEAKWSPWFEIYQEYQDFNALGGDNVFQKIIGLVQVETDLNAFSVFRERDLCDLFLYFPLMVYLLGMDYEIVVKLAVQCDMLSFLRASDELAPETESNLQNRELRLPTSQPVGLRYPERKIVTVGVAGDRTTIQEDSQISTFAGDDLILLAKTPAMFIYLYERPNASGKSLGAYDPTKISSISGKYHIWIPTDQASLPRIPITWGFASPRRYVSEETLLYELGDELSLTINSEHLDALKVAVVLEYSDRGAKELVEFLSSTCKANGSSNPLIPALRSQSASSEASDQTAEDQKEALFLIPFVRSFFLQAIDTDSTGAVEFLLSRYQRLGVVSYRSVRMIAYPFKSYDEGYPLHRAISQGSWSVAAYLYESGTWQDYKEEDFSVFHEMASARGWSSEFAWCIVERKKEHPEAEMMIRRDLQRLDGHRHSPVATAMMTSNMDAIEFFESLGADLDDPRMIIKVSRLEKTLERGTIEDRKDLSTRYKSLLSRMLDLPRIREEYYTYLHHALTSAPILLKMMIKKFYDPRMPFTICHILNPKPATSLEYSVNSEAIKSVYVLLKSRYGKELQSMATSSGNALFFTKSVGMLKLLLDNGLDSRIKDKKGRNLAGAIIRLGHLYGEVEARGILEALTGIKKGYEPPYLLSLDDRDEKGRTILHYIARYHSTTLAKKGFLERFSIDTLNARDTKGRTALHYAIIYDDRDGTGDNDGIIIRKLLKRGADINLVDKRGRPPIYYVIESGMAFENRIMQHFKMSDVDYGIRDEDDVSMREYIENWGNFF